MVEAPFRKYRHNSTEVMARQVARKKVVETDKGKIVLHPGDWEIIDEDGTVYGNTDDKFWRNYQELDE